MVSGWEGDAGVTDKEIRYLIPLEAGLDGLDVGGKLTVFVVVLDALRVVDVLVDELVGTGNALVDDVVVEILDEVEGTHWPAHNQTVDMNVVIDGLL